MLRQFHRMLLACALVIGLSGCAEDTSDRTTMDEVKASNALKTQAGVDDDAIDAAEDAPAEESGREGSDPEGSGR